MLVKRYLNDAAKKIIKKKPNHEVTEFHSCQAETDKSFSLSRGVGAERRRMTTQI